ncbi:hypothetical protein J4E86_004176 [Alternaria arbusti]|uniref:uncharacterized protein n=1 Tax=Alternaria arbusti TaxID=232088 RepID=UPI00221F83F3|nr:uncharacterized protein J4E86_004176 [Alternaria arbusti]KAI4958572.1 hypothetical protein J4E86_004176 [Alternaria arbusti]
MKFFTLALATLLAQTVTIAQSLFKHQSNGFRLILKSIDKNFNDHALGVCHWSAVHEGLCLYDDTTATPARPPTTFYHNVSSYDDIQGILNWPPPLWGTDDPVSSAMQFDYVAGTNLVYATFTPGTDTYQLVCFEEGSASMYIAIAGDDTRKAPDWVDPPKEGQELVSVCYEV